MNTLKVRLRNGFSDRMGIKKEHNIIQLNEFNDRTRIILINEIDNAFDKLIYDNKIIPYNSRDEVANNILIAILSDIYLKQTTRRIYYHYESVMNDVYETIKNDTYDTVLTVFEYIINTLCEIDSSKSHVLYEHINLILEQEFVGYRFLNKQIVPISNGIEVDEIKNVISSPFEQVNNHIDKSLEMLSNRENPDYENSIKESIMV